VYRFAPLEMSNAQRASIHGVDERVEVASLEKGELFHRALIQRLQ
jgi:carboxypeptidase PM20D1